MRGRTHGQEGPEAVDLGIVAGELGQDVAHDRDPKASAERDVEGGRGGVPVLDARQTSIERLLGEQLGGRIKGAIRRPAFQAR